MASAQFNDAWLTLTNETTTRLPTGALISDANNEIDFAWGDLDLDGFTDLVVARKDGTQVWMNCNPAVICGTAS